MRPPLVFKDSVPAVVGDCYYCGLPVYAGQPRSELDVLDEPLSHVACAVDARRNGTRQ